MRSICGFVLAAGVLLAAFQPVTGAPEPKEEKKVDKLKRPALDSKEWKKQGDDGLEVWDEKVGEGDAVKAGATVKVHYTGWLTDKDETLFDSSVKRGEPIEFGLDQVIKGWQDGVPGMKPGGSRLLKIPAKLAYGERAVGKIPANSTLVFRIELLK
jgi:FKBP-type peptidyl-prolyl cis-trans isomerase